MIEHRLIERMIEIAKRKTMGFKEKKQVDNHFVGTFIDFIRTYADRCHHGKEEDILFRELKKKSLLAEHQRIMEELIEEHKWGRNTVASLYQANNDLIERKTSSYSSLIESVESLLNFYPKHIEKEDKHFFIPVMEYFPAHEKEILLQEEYEFDQNLIHGIYGDMVKKLEGEDKQGR